MQQNYIFIDSFKSALHVNGNSFAHLQEHFDCMYSFLEQCTDSTADRWHNWDGIVPVPSQLCHIDRLYYIEMELFQFHLNCVTGRQQSQYIVPKSCIYSQSAPEDGWNCRPKHV